MNPIAQAHAIFQDGMAYVAAARELGEAELMELGCTSDDAAELTRVTQAYFGPTTFSRLQERAREAARHHHYHALVLITRYCSRVRGKLDRARLLVELSGLKDTAHIRRVAPARLRALSKRKPPVDGITMAFLRGNKARISITADRGQAADLKAMLGNNLEEIHQALTRGGGREPQLLTHIVIDLPTWLKLSHHEGSEVFFTATNGGVYSGKEIVQRAFREYGLITLVDPVAGPVNLYRTRRFASNKQRLMAYSQQTTCLLCSKPVENCQMHHMQAFMNGGMTNPENLCLLCSYHNGLNDDSRAGQRGYVERFGGSLRYVSPANHPNTGNFSRTAHGPPP